jgi:hypothetical protein
MKPGVRVIGEDGEVIAEFYAIKRKDNSLVVDGKALGVMRMDMILTSGELLRGTRILLSWGVFSYLLLLPYFILRTAFRRCCRVSQKGTKEEKGEGLR